MNEKKTPAVVEAVRAKKPIYAIHHNTGKTYLCSTFTHANGFINVLAGSMFFAASIEDKKISRHKRVDQLMIKGDFIDYDLEMQGLRVESIQTVYPETKQYDEFAKIAVDFWNNILGIEVPNSENKTAGGIILS